VQIDQDAIAAIKTSGIIGDKYVSIQLGPSDHYLKEGDTIRQTQSAFVLEDAIGQLINSSGSSKDNSSSGNSGDSSKDSKTSNSNCNCADTNIVKTPGKSAK
jgi:phospholipid/cholesterol/gamma-HCH transport system substrate-binding protein